MRVPAVQGQEDAQQHGLAVAALTAARALAAISAACAAMGYTRAGGGASDKLPEDGDWLADGVAEAVACQVPEHFYVGCVVCRFELDVGRLAFCMLMPPSFLWHGQHQAQRLLAYTCNALV